MIDQLKTETMQSSARTILPAKVECSNAKRRPPAARIFGSSMGAKLPGVIREFPGKGKIDRALPGVIFSPTLSEGTSLGVSEAALLVLPRVGWALSCRHHKSNPERDDKK